MSCVKIHMRIALILLKFRQGFYHSLIVFSVQFCNSAASRKPNILVVINYLKITELVLVSYFIITKLHSFVSIVFSVQIFHIYALTNLISDL